MYFHLSLISCFRNDTQDSVEDGGDDHLNNSLQNHLVVPSASTSISKTKERQKALDEAMLHYMEDCSSKRDEEGVFGEYIAASLRKLKPSTTSRAKMRIQQVLFEAEQNDFAEVENDVNL